MMGRCSIRAALGVAALAAGGCFSETTWFYPAPGQGSLVTNGDRLGVAKRLSGEDPEAQSFVVMSVREAYVAGAGGNLMRTIVQVTANLVNKAAAPARFESAAARLEVAGRAFAPKWISRWPEAKGGAHVAGIQDEVAPGAHVRFDLYFDLEPYVPTGYPAAPPLTGGIPLGSLGEFHVSWQAEWAGEKVSGKFRFVRDHTGRVGAGWAVAPGPYWGYHWWTWPYAWPTGIVVFRAHYPWRGIHAGARLRRRSSFVRKRPRIKIK